MQTLNQAQSLPLLPDSNYVVNNFSGPVSLTPTASPFPGRHTLTPAPSPDSAIHSTIYSPSQSPVPSRHGPLSGFSSTSLSRNSSDASQHGSSHYSFSSATSPLSPSVSPSIRYAHHPGYPSPDLPSSPLPRGCGKHLLHFLKQKCYPSMLKTTEWKERSCSQIWLNIQH